jgi:hypothetical protein
VRFLFLFVLHLRLMHHVPVLLPSACRIALLIHQLWLLMAASVASPLQVICMGRMRD